MLKFLNELFFTSRYNWPLYGDKWSEKSFENQRERFCSRRRAKEKTRGTSIKQRKIKQLKLQLKSNLIYSKDARILQNFGTKEGAWTQDGYWE